MKHAVSARDLTPGSKIVFDGRIWQVGSTILEPTDVVDLDLFRSDGSMSLHVGADDLIEIVHEQSPGH